VFGVAVGAAMFLLDMPNPVLWGVLAAIANYVPYLGGLVTTLVLGLVALLRFDDLNHALLVPALFVVLNFVEGNFLKPMVPILAALKIACDRIEGLAPIGEFLGP